MYTSSELTYTNFQLCTKPHCLPTDWMASLAARTEILSLASWVVFSSLSSVSFISMEASFSLCNFANSDWVEPGIFLGKKYSKKNNENTRDAIMHNTHEKEKQLQIL